MFTEKHGAANKNLDTDLLLENSACAQTFFLLQL